MPSAAPAAAVTRAWFDCTPPHVMSVSAPADRASAAIACIFLTLFPPPPNDSKSSRFMNSRGHAGPSALASRVNSSIGVGCGASGMSGSDISVASAVAMGRIMLSEK